MKENNIEELLKCSDLCSTPVGKYRATINIEMGLSLYQKMCLVETSCIAQEQFSGIKYCKAYQMDR